MAQATNVIGSDIGNVRLLITDTDLDNAIFNDDEVGAFLTMSAIDGTNDVRLASALALEVIARSEVLIQKKIKLLDLTTDGPAVAKELRASAKLLREQSAEDSGEIDWIEFGLTKFNKNEIIYKDALRNE